jgi:hypothetical protein
MLAPKKIGESRIFIGSFHYNCFEPLDNFTLGEKMKVITFLIAILMTFVASAEFKINPETGQGYNTDKNGAWGTDGIRLNRAGNSSTYFGSDGGVYEQQGNQIRQIGGFQSQQNNNNFNNGYERKN